MEHTTNSRFTPTRVAALVLICLMAGWLVSLYVGADPYTVSVPLGASAGDLLVEPCEYVTENGSRAADCGTLVVPEDRSDPQSRLIALPVIRIRSLSDSPTEPIFRLEGGPGQSNMTFRQASRYADHHDVVLVGYRGIDGSVRLDCPEVESALKRSTGFLEAASLSAYAEAFESCASRLTAEGIDATSYGMVQQVDDLEAARIALGYDRINLLSESAGTRTALIYAWRHPESIHRSILVGANPPGNFVWDGETTDRQMARFAELCAEDVACSGRTTDLAATMDQMAGAIPDRWLFLPIKESNARVMAFFALMQTTAEDGTAAAPGTFDAWLSAAEGDASGLWISSALSDLMVPRLFVWGQYAAAAMIDGEAARSHFAGDGGDVGTNLGRAATAYGWGGGLLVDAWPAPQDIEQYLEVRDSDVETLVISGELDTSTPPQVAATELMPHLSNGSQVILTGFSHSPSFWADQPEAGTRMILAFLESGTVDASLYKPQSIDFTPGMTMTMLGKIVAGSMVALAAVTILTLLWMARRVGVKGRIGGKAAAAIRTVHVVLLGFGGWCIAALLALTLIPGLRIDDTVLMVVSVSVPIGLGVHLAWVHRDWSPERKRLGLGLAASSALVGGWLGFHATGVASAVLTTIVGAAVGANLALLLLDMSADQPAAADADRAVPVTGSISVAPTDAESESVSV